MKTVLLLTVGVLLGLAASAAAAPPYFNSSEPGCDGSDPNVLFCESFDDGNWYTQPASQGATCATAGNPFPPPATNKGWCGNPGAGTFSPPTAASGKGYGGTPYAARMPKTGGAGASNMGDHALVNFQTVTEWYTRLYYRADPGYQWAGQKFIAFNSRNPGDGGIDIANTHFNCGTGGRTSTANLQLQVAPPQDECLNHNVSSLTIVPGRWYYVETHIKLNTVGQANGTYRLWLNDCGVDGTTCGAAPILRANRTNINYPRCSGCTGFRNFVIDQWANSPAGGSSGTDYIDQIKVSKAFVGFMGAAGTTPPPVTTTFTLTTATTGAGAVSGAGSYPSGTVVTPVALPASGSTFSGWSGDCTGSGACTVTMTGNKTVTGTFTTTAPPTTSVPPMPSSPSVALGTQDATGVTFTVAWPAVAGATSYSYQAGLSDNSANLQGAVTPPNLLLKTPYMANGAAGSGFVCIKSVNAAGSSEEAACNSLQIPAKTVVIPPPTTGTLTVDAQITRCNYFLTAEPPDATGGWVAQFYRDGSSKVGNPISAAPYKRSVELYAPSHSFSVQFTKTGQVMRSPAVVTRACP